MTSVMSQKDRIIKGIASHATAVIITYTLTDNNYDYTVLQICVSEMRVQFALYWQVTCCVTLLLPWVIVASVAVSAAWEWVEETRNYHYPL